MKPTTLLPLLLALGACESESPHRSHGSLEDAGPTDPHHPPSDAGAESPADGGTVPQDDAGVVADAGTEAGEDAGVPGPSMALSVQGSSFVRVDGSAVEVKGAISCCGGGYGWPLFDESWADRIHEAGGNFLHARLGPFLSTEDGESDWAATGGGYVEVDGQADLTRFNEDFWARVRALLQYARDRQLWVEVDVIDGWSLKHCQAGDLSGYSAWDPAFNLQGLDGCSGAGAGAAGPLHEAWIRKVVEETGRFDNVLYQDGNEIGLVQNYDVEWTRSLHALLRDEEAARGYTRHPFGTNAGSNEAMQLGEVDYLELHQTQALSAAQCLGKPCMVNEYNPSPALTPSQFQQRYCSARAQGTAFWYWRHEQSEEQLQASLELLDEPCPAGPPSTFPSGVPEEGFVEWASASTDTDPAVDATVNAAMAALTGCNVGSSCDLSWLPGANADEQCQAWFSTVNAELRQRGLFAGQHEEGHTDEIAVSNSGCAGRWYGYHVCNYGGPLVVWNPGARRGWWRIDPSYCP